MSVPALVIARDRLSYVQRCVAALDEAGARVHVVDHGSTYEPLLQWYRDSGVPVIFRGDQHPRSLWEWDRLAYFVGWARPYVVTDPDVMPVDGCPTDWLEHLREALECYPGWLKAGLSLRVSDLPAHYAHAERVPLWEAQWWRTEIYPGWFSAGVDTTLALYRPLSENARFAIQPALRSAPPYEAHHLTWYENSTQPTEEARHYAAHLPPLVSHWSDPAAYEGGGGR